MSGRFAGGTAALALAMVFLLSACGSATPIAPAAPDSPPPASELLETAIPPPIASPPSSTEPAVPAKTPPEDSDGLFFSKDDEDILVQSTVVRDFDGDGVTETLAIEHSTVFSEGAEFSVNRPVRFSMSVDGGEPFVFESLWNDGVTLSIADFDPEDPYLDLYVVESGTDISCDLHIYRYQDKQIVRYDKIYIIYSRFHYDGQGRLLFTVDYEDLGFRRVAYDYQAKTQTLLPNEA